MIDFSKESGGVMLFTEVVILPSDLMLSEIIIRRIWIESFY